jgi:putative cell wall-binding protein
LPRAAAAAAALVVVVLTLFGAPVTASAVVVDDPGQPMVSGTVSYPTAMREGTVKISLLTPAGDTIATVGADADTGGYAIKKVPAGDYVVKFTETSGRYFDVFWEQKYQLADAVPISVSTTQRASRIDAALSYRSIKLARIAGDDRFGTNRAVNDAIWPEGPTEPPVIYLTNGYTFPDALSAGPAAAHLGGAIVLTDGAELTPSMVQQITDAEPSRIVVVGGLGSMSARIEEQAVAIAGADATVRAGGGDRYETSRLIAADAFCSVPAAVPGLETQPEADTLTGAAQQGAEEQASGEPVAAIEECGAGTALFATGRDFPDALAAGPAAAAADGPVILLPEGGADDATRALITSLGITTAAVIGGEASVSSAAYDTVSGSVANTSRVAGDGRYATSVAIADAFFDHSARAYVASGTGFPDALGSGPLAAAFDAPLFLSPVECLPEEVWQELLTLHSGYVTLIGGYASLGVPLNTLTRCPAAATSHGFTDGGAATPDLTPEVETAPSLG